MKERIAELLREHREHMSQNTAWDECVDCSHQGQDWAEHVAELLMSELELQHEDHWGPISVAEFNDDGSPVMDERMVIPVQKHHFEWATRERWVTPWVESGPRETSEELSARLS